MENERRNWEVDIAAVKDAINTDKVIDPDPNDIQRWFKRLSNEDQMEINGSNSQYMREVHDDCESRFGGVARYSNN